MLWITLVGLSLLTGSLSWGAAALVRKSWELLTVCGAGTAVSILILWIA